MSGTEKKKAIESRTVSQILENVIACVPDTVNAAENASILPDPEGEIQVARRALAKSLPEIGTGFPKTLEHLISHIVPGLNLNSLNPRYYGFVTGGVTPAALAGDFLTSIYDQNVGVHLPKETIATNLEVQTLDLLLDLLRLDRETFPCKTFTTGATASNVLGLALGREWLIGAYAKHNHVEPIPSVGDQGLVEACLRAKIGKIEILSTLAHSSIVKAASIVGLGRSCVREIPVVDASVGLDLDWLRNYLVKRPTDVATILSISAGEVNTGHFATPSFKDFQEVRALCDAHNIWIHVDGAFGLFGRLLLPAGDEQPKASSHTSPEYDTMADFSHIASSAQGFELADSITGDGHKFLNVPYDCGFFFSRHKDLAFEVFQNGNAAYLAAPSAASTGAPNENDLCVPAVPSPLNIGIENSRRLRALPVYASLMAYGRNGYTEMLKTQIRLARKITQYLLKHEDYVVLPYGSIAPEVKDTLPYQAKEASQDLLERKCSAHTYIIVLFHARDPVVNAQLVKNIKKTGKIYVSGTKWKGQDAARIAISNWKCDVDRDFQVVKDVLDNIVKGH